MNTKIVQRFKKLPAKPGVYAYRDKDSRVIYVGKAVNLRHRVSSYFQSGEKDPKTTELVTKIEKLDVVECGSEFEALVLEAELIKRYKPKYNIKLKDDKNYVYIKISGDSYPRVSVTRQVVDHMAKHIGPFIDAGAVRSVLKMARKIFPFCTCSKPDGEVCLYYHIGLCRGHDKEYVAQKDYLKDIRGLEKLFAGKTDQLEKDFKRKMKKASKEKKYEEAASYRDKIYNLGQIKKSHFISERDLAIDKGLVELRKELGLEKIPAKIESFDISNIMGNHAVGSMVVFRNGIANPKEYRRFQIRTVKGSNDFAMMAEVLARRFRPVIASDLSSVARRAKLEAWQSGKQSREKIKTQKSDLNRNSEPARPAGGLETLNSELPDLVILDGGKGQLSAVLQNIIVPDDVKIVALAKRQEQIFSVASSKFQAPSDKQIQNSKFKIDIFTSNFKFQISNLPERSEAFYLVQRIRDEAHRFAVTYHRKVRSKEFFASSLDGIPGIGPKTRKKLISEYGSIEKIKEASVEDLSKIIPKTLAEKIKEQL